jgi:hypothetical protein
MSGCGRGEPVLGVGESIDRQPTRYKSRDKSGMVNGKCVPCVHYFTSILKDPFKE